MFATLDGYAAADRARRAATRPRPCSRARCATRPTAPSSPRRCASATASTRAPSPATTEAELTFLGATSERDPADSHPLAVIDVGGGSTEVVVGAGREVSFHVSTQAGVVRQTERHLPSDPPEPDELHALAAEIRGIVGVAIPDAVRRPGRARDRGGGNGDELRGDRPGARALRPRAGRGPRSERGLAARDPRAPGGNDPAEAPLGGRPASRSRADDRGRRGDPDRGSRPRWGSDRSRSPSTTSCAARPSSGREHQTLPHNGLLRTGYGRMFDCGYPDPRAYCAHRARAFVPHSANVRTRYIGSGEAASYRRLPPLGPRTGPSRHVPLPVLTGPLLEAVGMTPAAFNLSPRMRLLAAGGVVRTGPVLAHCPPRDSWPATTIHTRATGCWGTSPRAQARFERRGYTTLGSVRTFTSAGRSAARARSSAGRS